MEHPASDRSEIAKFLNLLLTPGDVIELRALNVQDGRFQINLTGYYDDPARLAADAAGIAGAVGVYVTLNPVSRALLSRAANRIKRAERGQSTGDGDVVERRWLLVDFDCKRPAGISASNSEHAYAIDRAKATAKSLHGMGWPWPIGGDSGNGAHLLYAIRLPADDGGLVRGVLSGLAYRFNVPGVDVDQAVFNASRISKLFGTVARKGDHTEERPHRLSRMLWAPPGGIIPVPHELLEAMAASVPAEPKAPARRRAPGGTPGELPTLDVDAWLRRHGLPMDGPTSWNSAKGGPAMLWELHECPWNPEHGRAARVVQFASGAISAGCFHNSCSWDWRELRERFDGPPPARPDRTRKDPGPATGTGRGNGGRPADAAADGPTGEPPGYEPGEEPGDPPDAPGTCLSPDDEFLANAYFTDLGNAERLVYLHGKEIRYTLDADTWFCWDVVRWACDAAGARLRGLAYQVARRTMEIGLGMGDTDAGKALAKHGKTSESNPAAEKCVSGAETIPAVQSNMRDFDADGWILNTPTGIVDLRTGDVRPHDPAAYCSKQTGAPYEPSAECPLWESVLDKIFAGDQELIGFVQRAVGYSLTGSMAEQVFFIMQGGGQNGKSTFLNVIRAVLGDYAISVAAGGWMVTRADASSASPHLTGLPGARFASSLETRENQELDASLIKAAVGGDEMSMRELYGKQFTFQPTAKPWFGTNHFPRIEDSSEGMWRRIRVIPFTVSIPPEERIPNLEILLRAELPGILTWAMAGCLDWQQGGLRAPQSVTSAIREYRHQEDHVAAFLSETYAMAPMETPNSPKPFGGVNSGEVFKAYELWMDNNVGKRERRKTSTGLGRYLTAKGFPASQAAGGSRIRLGLRPLSEYGPEPSEMGKNDQAGNANEDLDLWNKL